MCGEFSEAQFVVEVDASDIGVGVVLSQQRDQDLLFTPAHLPE